MTKNSIPALSALSRLQETASAGQQAVGGGHGIKVTHEKTSVSFTVVASSARQIVLQDNANNQRFSLPSNAFTNDSLARNTSNGPNLPTKGDTLILVNANERQLSFRWVQQSSQQGQGNTLPAGLSRALVASWPDLNLSAVGKAPLSVSAQMPFDAGDPKLAALAKVITLNATKLGQPLIELPLSGKVVAIQNANAANTTALVKLSMASLGVKDINFALPLAPKQAANIQSGAMVEVVVSPNKKGAAIQSIKVQGAGLFSASNLAQTNKANPQLNATIGQISQQTLFKAMQTNANSQGTKSVIQALQKPLLNVLPANFIAQLNNATKSGSETAGDARLLDTRLLDTRLLITPQKTLATQTGQTLSNSRTSNNSLMLVAVAKPLTIQVQTSQLNSEQKQQVTQHISQSTGVDIGQKPVSGSSGIQISQQQGIHSNLPNVSVASTVNHSASKAPLNTILSQVQQLLSPEELTQLPPKLQQALNHTLSHSEPSAPVMREVKAVLQNLMSKGSPETRALLKPLLLQLQNILGQSNTNTKSDAVLPNKQTTASGDIEGNLKLAELLRSSIAAQAVTQLTSMQQTNVAPNNVGGTQNSFVDGLVTLLKLSLAAKLAIPNAKAAGTPELTANIAAFASSVIKQINPRAERGNTPKILQDIALNDPRGSLISEIGKLLSTHNSQKLRSAEASLQGQDTYYYGLPNVLNPQGEDIEIAIKREAESQREEQENKSSSTWKLDMKLDVGKHGTVLAKTQFTVDKQAPISNRENHEGKSKQNEGIDLHLYTSNEALKGRVLTYLPVLLNRLEALGIHVKSQACDVGKVEDTLFKTQLSVMHAYA